MNIWYTIGKTFLPQLTWRRKVTDKIVYLTFDDGPHPQITPWVIDELDKVGAKGTFFMVGDNVRKHTDTFTLVKNSNNATGNHTMHHVKGWNMSAADYSQDIAQCDQQMNAQRLFRPPFGRINFKAIKAISQDKEIIMWDVLTKDYLPGLQISRALARIKKQTRPGSIIVFHDSEKAELNLKALLPPYLQFLKQEGYQMHTL
ncbi:MAG: polysaccharide deacetylase family protein [Bacteroidetes bacterium]|nr:polysaccharide deacetylase family protein [Bacteroidota bacterium]